MFVVLPSLRFMFAGQVVPVTTDIGLIEWVQNTRPLKAVIEQGLGTQLGFLDAPEIFVK